MDNYDPYCSDPVFKSKEELEDFMSGCNLSTVKDIEDEDFDFESVKNVKKVCTCGQCEDVWSDQLEHLCRQQTDRY